MSKSALTIHKEILKKEYAESPLGKIERELTKIYDGMKLSGQALPEDVAKDIFDVRDENEKWQMNYIDERLKLDREAVDSKLLESMSKELDILQKHGYTGNR